MSNSQEFSSRKKILPIKSVEQLAASYLVAQIIVDIRKELEVELEDKAIESIPKLERNVPKELENLYIEASKIVKFKPHLVFLMKFAIEDMVNYAFAQDPSVIVAATNDTSHLSQSFGPTYTNLSKINLMNHTINVFSEAVVKAKSKGRSSGVVLPMIGALLHDFGKSSGIRQELLGEAGSRGYKAHAEVSSTYISEILSIKLYNKFNEIQNETMDVLKKIVKEHHPSNLKGKTDPAVAFVIEADHAARKKEYKELLQAKTQDR